jgi:hypothetical protein
MELANVVVFSTNPVNAPQTLPARIDQAAGAGRRFAK